MGWRRLVGLARGGFNEAPAFLPGKINSRANRADSRPGGFNEAPAFLPGKIGEPWPADEEAHGASMRP